MNNKREGEAVYDISKNIQKLLPDGAEEKVDSTGETDGISFGEQALWRAVITQALMDAGNNSRKRDMRYQRARATAWLGSNSRDLLTVCSLAGMDPSYVKKKAREAIRRGCVWRKGQVRLKKKVTVTPEKKGRLRSGGDNVAKNTTEQPVQGEIYDFQTKTRAAKI